MQNSELDKKSNRLLSCPFCGGEVSTYTEQVDANTVSYGFVCNDCFCNTYFDFADEEKAIDMWNTRKPMERIVEQLEELDDNVCGKTRESIMEEVFYIVRNGGKE